jgi:hypothetical protein
MNRKPFGKTIRQELIDSAALKLRIWRREGVHWMGEEVAAGYAIAAILDGVRPGTLGGQMKDYVVNLSEAAASRLEATIEREAR